MYVGKKVRKEGKKKEGRKEGKGRKVGWKECM